MREPPRAQPPRSELLLKLSFAAGQPPEMPREHVRAHREQCAADVEMLDGIEALLRASDQPEAPFWLMTLRYGRRVRQAELEWCDETLVALQRLESRD